MSARTQAKILRAIQDGRISRVGSGKTITTDVRILAATNRDLASMIRAGTFREDLYFRLAVVPLRVPPLSERLEDIPALVSHLAAAISRRRGRRAPPFSPEALASLARRPYPGNVRELSNLVERALLFASGPLVAESDVSFPRDAASGDGGPPILPEQTLAEAREAFERRVITRVLSELNGNVSRTAERLGLDRTTLHRKLRSYGVE
jgi:two-component system nitrogen regulation response regulator NtrX